MLSARGSQYVTKVWAICRAHVAAVHLVNVTHTYTHTHTPKKTQRHLVCSSAVHLCLWFQHTMLHHTAEITAVYSTSHPASQPSNICPLLPVSALLWELWWFLRGSNNCMLQWWMRKGGCDHRGLFIDGVWKEQERGQGGGGGVLELPRENVLLK